MRDCSKLKKKKGKEHESFANIIDGISSSNGCTV